MASRFIYLICILISISCNAFNIRQREDSLCKILQEKTLSKDEKSKILLLLASLYRENNASKAVLFGRESIVWGENNKDSIHLPIAYANYAHTMAAQGNYPMSLHFLNKSIEIWRKQKNKLSQGHLYQALAYKLNFEIKNQKHDFNTQQTYFEKAASKFKEAQSVADEANALYGLGLVFQEQELNTKNESTPKKTNQVFNKSTFFFEKAIQKYQEAGLPYRANACRLNLAKLNLAKGDTVQALQEVESAIREHTSYESLIGLGDSYLTLSLIYNAQNKHAKAIHFANEGIRLFQQTHYYLELANAYLLLAKIYEKQKAWHLVLDIERKAWEAKQVSYNENKSYSLLDIQNNYENKIKNHYIQQLSFEKQISDLKNQQAIYWIVGIVALFFIVIIVGIWFIRLNKTRLLAIKEKAEIAELLNTSLIQKSKEAELVALNAEMNPHFVNNIMSSVQGLILKNKQSEAIEYLNDFSDLSRNTLHFSRLRYISLQQELNFLKNYIALEALRFESKFDVTWSIDSSLDLNDIEIPPMLIQPIVENAIKHGLMPKNGPGTLKIGIYKGLNENQILFEITDNGVGRKAKKQESISKHHSRGTEIIAKRLEILNETSPDFCGISIEDLVDETENSLGTKVILTLNI